MNLPALIDESRTPLLSKYETNLSEYRLHEDVEKHLIPLNALEGLEAELEVAKKPAAKDEVTKWAKMLIGAYPTREMQDAGVFVRSLVFDMADFPENILERAVHKVRRGCKFLPSCSEVREACEAEMKGVELFALQLKLHRLGHKRIEAGTGRIPAYEVYKENTGQGKKIAELTQQTAIKLAGGRA